MKQSVCNYKAFMAKEFMESMRTKRFLILGCIFIFFGIFSALMARYSVEIMGYLMNLDESGLVFEIPPPVWIDSYGQLYSNLSEMGIIVLIVMYMSVVLREKTTGTIDLMFTKGLSSTTFVWAKFTVAALLTLTVLLGAVLITYFYTMVLFEYGGQIGDVLLGGLVFGVFILMILALTILWSSIANSTAISAVLGLGSYLFIGVMGFIPRIGQFMPGNLTGHVVLLSGSETGDYLWIRLLMAMAFTVVALVTTAQILKKRKG